MPDVEIVATPMHGTAPSEPGSGFDEFYASQFQRLTLQLWAYTGDLAEAQDVVQEAFCRALARWSRIAGYDDPVGWVRRVALNLASNHLRRLRTVRRLAGRHREAYVPEPAPDRLVVVQALSGLPADQRRALVLYHLADLSVGEIAAQDGVSENTVKSWLRRGRAALAAKLTEKGAGDDV